MAVALALGAIVHAVGPARVAAHDTPVAPLVVGSTAEGGGALRLERSANDPVLLTQSFSGNGFVLYTAADPSFENPEADETVFPLLAGTQVTVDVVGIGDTAGVKLRGESLLAVGDSVVLGTAPSLHAHPEWQLTLPVGTSGCQTVHLRVRAATTYAASDEYVLQLTNDVATCGPVPTPIATPTTPEPTATPVAGAVCGDGDGGGTVRVTDGAAELRPAADWGGGCADTALCDVDASGTVSVSDGVNVLRAAAGLATNLSCPDS